LHIGSRDANDPPKIHANYLSDPLDREMIVAVLKSSREDRVAARASPD
jgi:hypothetical protein